MKKISKHTASIAGLALVAATTAVIGTTPTYAAEPDCIVTNETIDISGTVVPCIITETTSTINITGTYEEIGDVLFAFKSNAGFNYATYAATSIINITTTNEISSQVIDWLASIAPTGATVSITPQVSDLSLLVIPYSMPTDFTLKTTNLTIHLPSGTTLADAFDTFVGLADATITVAINDAGAPNITEENGLPTIHFPVGTSIADALTATSTITPGVDFVIASGNVFVAEIPVEDDIIIHLLDSTLTPDEALALLAGVTGIDATVNIYNNDAFTITLSAGEAPVVTPKETNISTVNAPVTGIFTAESAGSEATILVALAASTLLTISGLAISKRKRH